ncbi:MAG: type VI secretion system protein TssA [Luteitalea sp.]|nr:type VI secretion system protein TssA [Luteitalea sp.]
MSGRWESQALLEPVTADEPCGENLEDTALLASFDALRLFGQSTSPDAPPEPSEQRKPPEWGEIRANAIEALGKSKDLRLLAYLGTALLRTDGLPAFFETLTVASRWLESYWSHVYPLVDEDAIARRNALNCFADPMAVVERLRRVPLVESRQHGTFSLRDIDLATGQVQVGTEVRPDEGQINAAFTQMPLDQLEMLQQSVDGAVDALNRIDARMRSEGGPEVVPSFDPLSAPLVRMNRLLRARLASRPDGSGPDGTDGTSTETVDATGVAGGTPLAVGAIKSRQDAIRALDAVAEYFRRNEPSSPIPLFLERAKRLVSKDFLEVLADIAPEALAVARAAGGVKQEE